MAQAARAIVRRAVLTMLDQGNVGRVRVSWDIGEDLAITVRDDGSGDLSADALALQAMVDRAHALGGTGKALFLGNRHEGPQQIKIKAERQGHGNEDHS